jgi:hypothetical protein
MNYLLSAEVVGTVSIVEDIFPYGVGIQRQLKLVAPLYPVYVTVHIGTVAVGMMMAGFSTFQNSPTDY